MSARSQLSELKKGWVAWVILVFLIIGGVMLGLLYQVSQHTAKIETLITVHERKPQEKGLALEQLVRQLGYGGFIHHFKNHVLRRDPAKAFLVAQRLKEVDQAINKLSQLDLNGGEREALTTVMRTVAQYRAAFQRARAMIDEGYLVTEIDAAVKVDDGPALEALGYLERSWVTSRSQAAEFYSEYQAEANILLWLQIAIFMLFFLGTLVAIYVIGRFLRQAGERATRLSQIMDNAVDGIITIDAEGSIQSFNGAAESLFGYEAFETLGKNVKMLMPEPFAGRHDGYLKNYLTGGTAQIIGVGREVIGLRKDGSTFPMDLSVSEATVEGRKIFTGITRDLSLQKRATAQFRLSHQVIDASPDPIAVISADHRVVQVNNAFSSLFNVVNAPKRDLFLPEVMGQDLYEASIKKEIDRCFNGEEIYSELEIVAQNGQDHHYTVRYLPLQDESGDVLQVVYVAQDVTELKSSEEALRRTLTRFDLATQSGGIGVWDWDIIANHLDWDDEMYRIYGQQRPENEEPYETWEKALHPDDLEMAKADINAALAGECNFQSEFRIVRPDGEVRVIVASGVLVRDTEGNPANMSGVNIDITEKKMQEQEINRAREAAEQANRAKSDFLSSMSHELRTPLNAILGFAQLLSTSKKNPLNDRQKGQAKQIIKGGEYLLTLINEVLDLAKIEAGKLTMSLEPVHTDSFMYDCLSFTQTLAAKRQIRIHDRSEGGDHVIWADHTRVKQAVLNLLSNAVKYNKEGGTIWVDVGAISPGLLRIKVTDTGPGIAVEKQTDMFRPFNRLGAETTDVEGTGIGLVLTKKLVEEMGGRIGFESTIGEGCAFWIDLPIAAGELPKHPCMPHIPEGLPTEICPKGRVVLYVEDNPANLEFMEDFMADLPDYSLISTHTAELGLAMAEEQLPDVIILDVNLPGMDGTEAVRHLKRSKKTAHIPVLALSADAMPSSIRNGKEAGFDEYLTKPVDINVLYTLLNKVTKELA
ncbi:PAS domain-containing hybrid sensor histidine kinase/response regulator [Magnetospira sp. QH-2]|uniref:hybrid sensor histidine kinase/response regulator n=1 Tax=Magnetospira sp. (strain QH-2) TaxID=1288970 RepID=UPI0003E80CCE|nr:PAS domain-containing hybrid sensor histidine kinase/response regulator [Magnetospira sp. QH-2]CCQ72686.1 putative Histidine kinase [Magnetospira sp. QH-2]